MPQDVHVVGQCTENSTDSFTGIGVLATGKADIKAICVALFMLSVLLHRQCPVYAPADAHCCVQDPLARIGRLTFPISMLAFPFYLMSRSPGKQGSHYDPKADLFVESEEPLVSPSAQPAFA